LTAFLLPT